MEERRYCSIQEQIISNLCFVPRGKKQLKLKFTRQTYTHTQRACYITMIILMTIFDLFWRDDMHHRYVYPVCLPRAIDVSLLTSDVAQYLPVIDQRDPNVSFTHRVVRCLEEDSSNIHHNSHQLVSRDIVLQITNTARIAADLSSETDHSSWLEAANASI